MYWEDRFCLFYFFKIEANISIKKTNFLLKRNHKIRSPWAPIALWNTHSATPLELGMLSSAAHSPPFPITLQILKPSPFHTFSTALATVDV